MGHMADLRCDGIRSQLKEARSRKFLGMSEVALREIFVFDLFLITLDDQWFLGPVSCPAEMHCTIVFGMRNGKFSRLGVVVFRD